MLIAVILVRLCKQEDCCDNRIAWTLTVAILGWIGWCFEAGIVWGRGGFDWAFQGTPVAFILVLLLSLGPIDKPKPKQ